MVLPLGLELLVLVVVMKNKEGHQLILALGIASLEGMVSLVGIVSLLGVARIGVTGGYLGGYGVSGGGGYGVTGGGGYGVTGGGGYGITGGGGYAIIPVIIPIGSIWTTIGIAGGGSGASGASGAVGGGTTLRTCGLDIGLVELSLIISYYIMWSDDFFGYLHHGTISGPISSYVDLKIYSTGHR